MILKIIFLDNEVNKDRYKNHSKYIISTKN